MSSGSTDCKLCTIMLLDFRGMVLLNTVPICFSAAPRVSIHPVALLWPTRPWVKRTVCARAHVYVYVCVRARRVCTQPSVKGSCSKTHGWWWFNSTVCARGYLYTMVPLNPVCDTNLRTWGARINTGGKCVCHDTIRFIARSARTQTSLSINTPVQNIACKTVYKFMWMF